MWGRKELVADLRQLRLNLHVAPGSTTLLEGTNLVADPQQVLIYEMCQN